MLYKLLSSKTKIDLREVKADQVKCRRWVFDGRGKPEYLESNKVDNQKQPTLKWGRMLSPLRKPYSPLHNPKCDQLVSKIYGRKWKWCKNDLIKYIKINICVYTRRKVFLLCLFRRTISCGLCWLDEEKKVPSLPNGFKFTFERKQLCNMAEEFAFWLHIWIAN